MISVIIQKKTAQKPIFRDMFMYTHQREHYANMYIIHTNSPRCIPGNTLTPDAPGCWDVFKLITLQINITALRCVWGCSEWHWKLLSSIPSWHNYFLAIYIPRGCNILTETRRCCPRDYTTTGHLQSIYKSLHIYNIYKPRL